ncbi:MAG: type I 3-dehydroquinate dehydratase [Prevotellaceae bacterium]|jgi:3-dehydroquinate dehydratase type I|nr:type I 3-dehydroquinate dehydratase [Prevotellaceae bacterium]
MSTIPDNICVSVAEKTFDEISAALKTVTFAEIRLDACEITENEIRRLFSTSDKILTATCREGRYDNRERTRRLLAAVEAGATYVDVEAEADNDLRKTIAESAKRKGCKLIISHHDFEKTPEYEELRSIVDTCRTLGADIVKLVTTACSYADNARLMALYADCRDLLAFAMGETGKITRIACLYAGAPFTYAALSDNKPVACGQLSAERMMKIIGLLEPI